MKAFYPPSKKIKKLPVPQAAQPSPISSLPVDPLLAIFATPTLDPLLLSQVCTKWRNCALNSPTLWTNIRVVEVLEDNTSGIDRELKRIRKFLALSRNCPLTLDIALYTFCIHEELENEFSTVLPMFQARIKDIGRALSQHAHRIKSVILIVDEFPITTCFLGSFTGVPMPMLTSWDVHNTYEMMFASAGEALRVEEINSHHVLLRPRGSCPERYIQLYPNLQSVTLHSVPLHWSYFSPRNLVILEFKMLRPEWRLLTSIIVQILRANAHSLEKLTLLAVLAQDNYRASEVVTLPKVYFLELGYHHTRELLPLVQAITLPMLREFVLGDKRRQDLHPNKRRDASSFDAGIASLLHKMSLHLPLSQVQKLTLRHIAFCLPVPQGLTATNPLPDIIFGRNLALMFFCLFTTLQTLQLYNVDHVTLDALNCVQYSKERKNPKWPVPSMTVLHISNAGFNVLKSFIQMRLSSRVGQFRCLHELILHMPKSWYHWCQWERVNTECLAKKIHSLIDDPARFQKELLAM